MTLLATLSNANNVKRLKKRLQSNQYRVFTRRANAYTLVYVGPYHGFDRVKNVRDEIKNNMHLQGVIKEQHHE